MNILLIGGGGREHALAWKIAASPLADRVYCAAPAMREYPRGRIHGCRYCIVQRGYRLLRAKAIEFVVVGPEAPLVGLVDDLKSAGIKTFGPTKAAARLEGSKGFTKDLCRANNIPTAGVRTLRCGRAGEARACLQQDGHADRGQGRRARRRQGRRGGDDGRGRGRGRSGTCRRCRRVVQMEFLAGEEASFFVLSDGENAVPLATRHKRGFDGDLGPDPAAWARFRRRP